MKQCLRVSCAARKYMLLLYPVSGQRDMEIHVYHYIRSSTEPQSGKSRSGARDRRVGSNCGPDATVVYTLSSIISSHI